MLACEKLGIPVLAAWIPLRERAGPGTVLSAFVIGLATNVGLELLPRPESLALRIVALACGAGLVGLGSALYLSAAMGPGPRDGLMTGIVARTGWPVKWVRTAIELSVIALGWLLGGSVGVGTVLYAVTIGPLVHLFLPIFTIHRRGADA